MTGPETPLTFDEVSQANRERCKRWHEDSTAWTGADWATALGGEVGEALNVVKKIRRVECGLGPGMNDPPESLLRTMLAEELADVFLYLDLLAWHYEVDLPAMIAAKFNAVSERQGFPERLRANSQVGCPTCHGQPCPECGGSGVSAEQHTPWATEYLGCQNCHDEPCPTCGIDLCEVPGCPHPKLASSPCCYGHVVDESDPRHIPTAGCISNPPGNRSTLQRYDGSPDA